MAEESGEKSQEATVHRREQAREEGQVAHSQDLTSAGLLLGGLVVLIFTGGALLDFLVNFLGTYLRGEPWVAWINAGSPNSGELVMGQWYVLMPALGKSLLPVLGLVMVLAVVLNLLQSGILFLPHKLLPDISRINPLTGISRLLSMANAVRLAFGIFKIGIIATVAFVSLYNRRYQLLSLTALDLPQIAVFAWEVCLWTCIKIGIALLILAILDYGFQYWKHEQDLRMTPQEMREEMRNLQGDPQIIARRRAVQRQLALNRLSSAVPKADVVITNPTELAVALQYESDTMNAPIVVAKGAGVIAARIRRLALENGIPIVEKKPLAQTLYKEVEVNHPIPDKMYAAVAEVLAYVYQLKNKTIPSARA